MESPTFPGRFNPATVPEARVSPAIGYDGHELVMFGGDDSNTGTSLGDTWTWDGSNWTQQHPTPAPSARIGASMAWDGRELVLFGGTSRMGSFGGEFHDTWIWTGAGWAQQNPPQSPRAGLTQMAFDGHGAMAFGGQDPQGDYVADTWRWSGGTWTQLSPAHSPSARDGHEMDFDESRGFVLLTGGTSGEASHTDAWAWNGADWTLLAASLESSAGAMAFDGRTDVLTDATFYRMGGSNTTYTFEGSSWQPQQSAEVPPYGEAPALAFDPRHGDVVFFGGRGGSNDDTSFDQTWVWTEGAPPTATPTPQAVISDRPAGGSLPPAGATATSPVAAASPSLQLPASPPAGGTPLPPTPRSVPATAQLVNPRGSAASTVAVTLALALLVAGGSVLAIRRWVRARRR
jgi:hypothetical protein